MSTRRLLAVATIVSATALPAWAQQATSTIRGTVRTQDGAPAEAVSVGLKGRAQGAITDEKGRFVIERVADGEYTLVVSAVGLQTTEKSVTVSGGQAATVDFTLAESAQRLREVTVQGNRINKFSRKESVDVNKMPLSNLENPQVYATVGKELLTEQLVFTVDDATRNAPGLQKMWDATGRSGDGGAYYASRGFVVSSQLRNGVAGGVTSDIDAVNLEKLELIKGPSATLFGSALTSYGGLINRVTKKPTDTFGGEINVAAGSYGFHRVSADVNLVDQNVPADQPKTLGLRLNTAYTYEDSYQNKGYTGFNKNLAVAPSLQWRPSDRLTVNLDAEIYKGRGTSKQIIFFYFPSAQLGFNRAEDAPLDYRQSYTGPGLLQDSRSTNLFGQVKYRISPSFTSTTFLTSSNSYSNGNAPYFYLMPGANGGPVTLARADQSTQNSRRQVWEAQQLFNGDSQLGNLRNRVVLGLDFLRINNNQDFFGGYIDAVPLNLGPNDYRNLTGSSVQAAYAATPPSHYLVVTKSNTYSAFVSDVLNLTDKLSVLAALRLDHYDNKGGIYYTENKAYSQTTLSPKFGVVYQPVKDRLSLFANYQNSFKNPADGTFINTSGQAQSAKVEQANQWESGIKLDAANGRISATLSYYNISVQDLLRATPVAPSAPGASDGIPNAQTQNGTQISAGGEVNLTANPVDGLNIVAGYAYNFSEWQEASDIENGRRPNVASSPNLANVWVSYRVPAGTLRGLGAGFGGNYASENRIVNTTTDVFTLPSYTVLNASVFFDQPKYRISAKVDNLTDKQYWTGYTTMNPQKLRSIIGSVAYKF